MMTLNDVPYCWGQNERDKMSKKTEQKPKKLKKLLAWMKCWRTGTRVKKCPKCGQDILKWRPATREDFEEWI